MRLTLIRIANRPTYCIGKLYIDGKYFCDTIEDTDRGLKDEMSVEEILKLKVKEKQPFLQVFIMFFLHILQNIRSKCH